MSALLWAVLAAWAAMGAAAIAVCAASTAMRRVRSAGGLEALVEATREERFTDWDIRELTS